MANPNKAQDPAAAALSAIEEALNLTDLMPSETAPEKDGEKSQDGASRESRVPELKMPERHPLLEPEVTGRRRDETRTPRLPTADASSLFGETLREVEQANEPRLDVAEPMRRSPRVIAMAATGSSRPLPTSACRARGRPPPPTTTRRASARSCAPCRSSRAGRR